MFAHNRTLIKCPQCENRNHTLDDFVKDVSDYQWKREADTRRRVMEIMNKQREDFAHLEDYYAYMEERE